jgi:SNF2 family DNA or RNA helicase
MSEDERKFKICDKVQLIGDKACQGVVIGYGRKKAGELYYQVFWSGDRGESEVPESDLEYATQHHDVRQAFLSGNYGSWHDFQRLIIFHKVQRERPLGDHVYALNASRTKLYPYQFKPLLKFLDSPTNRMLIADEVGLGKTIEAGLIMMELEARQTLQRVLVICPANLRAKWQFELHKRFAEEFDVWEDAKTVRSFLSISTEQGPSPSTPFKIRAIVSYETLRARDLQEALQEASPDFDLVIFDEAHHLRNPGTLTNQLGHLISELTLAAGSMLMLTATPVQLGNQNLYHLLHILDEDRFPDEQTANEQFQANRSVVAAQSLIRLHPPAFDKALAELQSVSDSPWLKNNPVLKYVLQVLTDKPPVYRSELLELQRQLERLNLLSHVFNRTRKRDVHIDVPERWAHAVVVDFSPKERRFYDRVTEFTREQALENIENPVVASWVVNNIQRRMTSCIPAMIEYFRSRDDVDFSDMLNDAEDLDELGLEPNEPVGKMNLGVLRKCGSGAMPDSKFEAFLSTLHGLRDAQGQLKILVFSFFKSTLKYLERSLKQHGFGVRRIDGDVPISQRAEIINEFRDAASVEILLSSRVGSEGLDLQFCHSLANYDLPWNPMEVEQRIGRLDRIGQMAPGINIYNFWVSDTIESRILQRLYDRIEIFKYSIGDLEEIVGEVINDLEKAIFTSRLSDQEIETRIARAEQILENRKEETQKLEKDAKVLLGADEFFLSQVDAVMANRRYITSRQIQEYLQDFFGIYCAKTRIVADQHSTTTWRLEPGPDLKAMIRRSELSSDLRAFLARDSVEITFDSETAFKGADIDFINVNHALIRLATKTFQSEPEKLVSTADIVLASSTIPAGDYLYFVSIVKLNAARSQNKMELILIDEAAGVVLSAETTEPLLGEMLQDGRTPRTPGKRVDSDRSDEMWNLAEDELGKRVNTLGEETELLNEALLDSKRVSLNTQYGRKIEGATETLQEMILKGKKSVVPMWKGKIEQLQGDLDKRLKALDQLARVTCEVTKVGAGRLTILPAR